MKTKNIKRSILISTIVIVSIAVLGLFICGIYYMFFKLPPSTIKHMRELYQNDSNYITLEATVDETRIEYGTIRFSDLKTEEFFYRGNGFKVFAPDVQKLFSELELKKGDVIEIVSANKIFYDGYKYPIVSIKKDGVEYLSFEDGKAALLDWVNSL